MNLKKKLHLLSLFGLFGYPLLAEQIPYVYTNGGPTNMTLSQCVSRAKQEMRLADFFKGLEIIYDSNNLNSDIYIKLFDIDGNFINDMSLLNSVKGRQRSDLSGLIPINSSSGVYIMQFCFNTHNCSNHKITYLK